MYSIFHLNLTVIYFFSFLVSSWEFTLQNSCTPVHTQQPEETLQYHIYKISLRVKIHAAHLLCTLPFWIYGTLAAALKAKYPQGHPSAFQSKQPAIQQCQLTLNFLRIAPTSTYSQLKHIARKPKVIILSQN